MINQEITYMEDIASCLTSIHFSLWTDPDVQSGNMTNLKYSASLFPMKLKVAIWSSSGQSKQRLLVGLTRKLIQGATLTWVEPFQLLLRLPSVHIWDMLKGAQGLLLIILLLKACIDLMPAICQTVFLVLGILVNKTDKNDQSPCSPIIYILIKETVKERLIARIQSM